jgi:hypothetical protein
MVARALRTATVDSASVAAAISAKITYSLAAIESFGKVTAGPTRLTAGSPAGDNDGNMLTFCLP